jgi:hypothetical protein
MRQQVATWIAIFIGSVVVLLAFIFALLQQG